MKKATLFLDESGHPVEIKFDDEKGTPITAFLLLTTVPTDPPSSHILAYGNSDVVGRMLFSFWQNSIKRNPEGAWVIEEVAKDIINAAKKARGPEWQGDGIIGNA